MHKLEAHASLPAAHPQEFVAQSAPDDSDDREYQRSMCLLGVMIAMFHALYLGNVKMFLIGISAAVMFTILLVSANTMAMSVRERVREVGVLKTLGFTPGTILGMILGESYAIPLVGGTIGFLLSAILTTAVGKSPAGSLLPPISPFEPAVAAACILTAVLIGFLSSLVPAIGASRTPIVQALRSTD